MNEEILHRFFKGECTSEEAHEVLIWINSNAGEKELKKAFEFFELNGLERSETDGDRILAEIHSRIKEESIIHTVVNENDEARFKVSSHARSGRKVVLTRIAASILLVAVASLMIYFLGSQNVFDPPVAETSSDKLFTRSTEPGQKLTLHLSDGSVAVLNANSSVTFPERFSDSVRLVRMSGEVFFEVAENKEKPFVVRTSQLSTTALGTSFNIRAYDKQDQDVSLLTGKVKVEAHDRQVVSFLEPGEELSYRKGRVEKGNFNTRTKVLWKEGVIYFEKTSLRECFRTLENWYGIEIQVVGDDLSSTRKVSGRFDNDYLTNVLNSISYAHEFTYEIDQKMVYIKFKHR